jgi:hypothetical protein
MSWTIVPSANSSSSENNVLEAITCRSNADCWAVGYHIIGSTFNYATLTEHWDGASWSVITSPSPSTATNILFGVACPGGSDCWATGWNDQGSTLPALIEYWDGSAWSEVASAIPDNSIYYFLFGMACTSTDHCWAAGGANTADGIYLDRTFVQRWDGNEWTIDPTPNALGDYNTLYALACATDFNCWAIGNYQVEGVWKNLVLRYATTAPTLMKVASRKIHGTSGFDIDLPLTGAAGIECRSGGANGEYEIVFTFANPVNVNGTPNKAQITSGRGTVGNVAVNGTQVSVTLTQVTNAQKITLTLFNVTDGANVGDISVPINVLIGDTTNDGVVNSADIAQTKSQSGQSVAASNFREDVNADGNLNSADIALVKSKSGSSLP